VLTTALGPLPDWVFVGGKGGVGKTTVAASLAIACADAGHPTIVVSTDPAHSLGDVLGQRLSSEPEPVRGAPGLRALEVDSARERTSFLDRYGAVVRGILEDATYLDAADVESLLELPLPGIDELGALWRLAGLSSEPDRLVIDTAPTGHTLRMFRALDLAERWLSSLAELRARHAIVAERLGVATVADPEGDRLDALHAELRQLAMCLRDSRRTAFLLVGLTEPVVAAETRRYIGELDRLGIRVAAILVNRSGGVVAVPDPGGPDIPIVRLPRVDPDPVGVEALRRFAAAGGTLRSDDATVERVGAPGLVPIGEPYRPPSDRGFYLVVGKGGVGKTTVASALAILLSRDGAGDVLLFSTDPAGSLGDVWRCEVAREEARAPDEPGLLLRQLDADTAWAAFRDRFLDAADRAPAETPGTAGADRGAELLRELMEVAPAGLDELAAVLETVELLESGRYHALVLDTAPTGHFLRFVQAPDLVLAWTHAVMRLLLRYREAIGLGHLAENLLTLARRVRRMRDRLRSPDNRLLCMVTQPDALNLPEAERLLIELRGRALGPDLVLVNRYQPSADGASTGASGAAGALLRLAAGTPVVAAPELAAGPLGSEALTRFAAEWRSLAPAA
jgi:arsenite/tail-anchored protein-transporting ATPase